VDAAHLVTVVISGRRIDASHAARLRAGVVVAPLVPFVREIAERIDGDGSGRRFVVVRGDHHVAIALGSRAARVDDAPALLPVAPFARAGTTYVPLAALARALGGTVAYDAPSHTFAVTLIPAPIAAMTPTVNYTPPPAPLYTFTPKSTPQPQATVTGIPHPRRTPIEVDPDRDRSPH
jgi:hypothetical protein